MTTATAATPKSTIRHYAINPTGKTTLQVPKGAKFMGAGRRGKQAQVSALVDSDSNTLEARTIKARKEGQTVNSGDTYLGSTRSDPDNMDALMHIFEDGGEPDADTDDLSNDAPGAEL